MFQDKFLFLFLLLHRVISFTYSVNSKSLNVAHRSSQQNFTIRNNNDASTLLEMNSEMNLKFIHIGNINWNIPVKVVEEAFLGLFSNLSIVSFHLKPKSNRARDKTKHHGGSIKIEFEHVRDAHTAVKRLYQYREKDGLMGELRVYLFDGNDMSSRTTTKNAIPQYETILTEERLEYRKQRAEKYARQRSKMALQTDLLIQVLGPLYLTPSEVEVLDAPELDWKKVPWNIDPIRGGGLKKGSLRGARKQAQVEAILYVLSTLMNGDSSTNRIKVVADLGSGAGNLSLPLGWFLQNMNTKILAVDINPLAIERLKKRADEVGVEVETAIKDLEECSVVTGDFDVLEECEVVVSLHACGAASDLAIEAAVLREVPFIVSPCCIGKANLVRRSSETPSLVSSQRSSAPERFTYPRSKELETFCSQNSILADYPLIITAADYSIGKNDDAEYLQRGRAAKRVVELDRLKWAEEKGDYYTRVVDIPRLGLYPKKELLLGAKRGSPAAYRLSQLSTTTTQLFSRLQVYYDDCIDCCFSADQ